MKKHLTISVSKVFFNIVLFVLGVTIFITSTLLISGRGININSFSMFMVNLAFFLIVYDLRKIVHSTKLTPFTSENVNRFKRIGYYMLFIAAWDGIIKFKIKSYSEFFATEYGSLKGSFFIYLILAFIALVLADIFEKAVQIKNDNDLTI